MTAARLRRSTLVPEFQGRLRTFELGGGVGQRPHRGGGAALAAYDAAQLPWGHEQLHERLSPVRSLGDSHGVRVIRQSSGDHFHDIARAAHDAGCSATGAAGAGGMRATSVRTVSDGRAPVLTQ